MSARPRRTSRLGFVASQIAGDPFASGSYTSFVTGREHTAVSRCLALLDDDQRLRGTESAGNTSRAVAKARLCYGQNPRAMASIRVQQSGETHHIKRTDSRAYRTLRCDGCGLWRNFCQCDRWPPLAPGPIGLSIVMASTEPSKPSSTARLLSRWLPNVTVHVRGLPDRPFRREQLPRENAAILFPAEEALPLFEPEKVSPDTPRANVPRIGPVRHLIVPDGTWSQARRIVRHELATLGLPFVRVPDGLGSSYTLRSKPQEALCTLEAVAAALGALGDQDSACAIVDRFATWTHVANQLRAGQEPKQLCLDAAPHPLRRWLEGRAHRTDAAVPPTLGAHR